MRTSISIPWLDKFINYSTRLFRSALYNLGEDSTIECLAVPRFDVYDIMCNISSGISMSLVSSFSAWPSSCYSTATIIGQRNQAFPTLLVGLISGTTNPLTIGNSAESQWVCLFCCQS